MAPPAPQASSKAVMLLAAIVVVTLMVVVSVVVSSRNAGREAAPERASDVTIVVDRRHATASDDNPGTAAQPLASVGRAVELAAAHAAAGRPVTVRVGAGVYREALAIDGSELRAPLTVEGAGRDATIVDGSEVWTGWQPLRDTGLHAHPWPYDWGLADLPSRGWEDYFERNDVSDTARRREAVWVDGIVLRQVLDRDGAADQPGTFLVDEEDGLLVVHPPDGVALADATVEVAVRERLLDVVHADRLTLRGIGFRRAATPLQQAAVRIDRSRSVLAEDVRSSWNSWTGLAVQRSEDVTIRDTTLDHNGVMGLSVWRVADLQLVNVTNSYNNTWRGRWAGYLGWSSGAKLFSVRRVDIEGWTAVGNDAHGLWLDTDIADVTIRGSYIAGNLRRGIFLEATQGPVVITDTVVCGNGSGGVLDGKANHVTIERSRIVGNDDAQLIFSGARGGRTFTTYDTDEERTVLSERWTLRANVFGGTGEAALVRTTLGHTEWALLSEGLAGGQNVWHHPTNPHAFELLGSTVGYAAWRDAVGEDDTSRFSPEAAPGVCAPPAG